MKILLLIDFDDYINRINTIDRISYCFTVLTLAGVQYF